MELAAAAAGPQGSFWSTAAGQMEQREGEAGAIPRQADWMNTRPSGSGPTRQSDARDSDPTRAATEARAGYLFLSGCISFYPEADVERLEPKGWKGGCDRFFDND